MATKKISDLQLISAMADDVNLPGENTSQTYRVTGAQVKTYIQTGIADLMKSSKDLLNLGLSASVSSNALTINLKQIDGSSAPSATAPVRIGFRGTTAGNGDASLVSATAATSLVVSSGSTLGTSNAVQAILYVYAINNGGTIELAISKKLYDEGSLVTTTAEGGAGAADSGSVIYSTTARSSKALRLIGRLVVTEATAGTWASAPSEVSVAPFSRPMAPTCQRFASGTSQTYTLPTPAPAYLRVRMSGGGGGGGGSGTTAGTAATDGGDTTWVGSATNTAGKGLKGARNTDGGAGGTATVNLGTQICAFSGGNGGPATNQGTSPLTSIVGGYGGQVPMIGGGGTPGAGGGASTLAGAGGSAPGGGGGGAGMGTTTNGATGSGGGAGAYCEFIIENPAATYTYSVGANGSGQAAGTSGAAGGAGATGVIIVEEHYQ